jgi:hypothetical protein
MLYRKSPGIRFLKKAGYADLSGKKSATFTEIILTALIKI